MSTWKFLGLAQEPQTESAQEPATAETETVRKIVAALDRLEPGPRYPSTWSRRREL